MIWKAYVAFARDLVGQESEAAKRSGVSRAYYGAFNSAKRWLEAHGTRIDAHRAHTQVWESFRIASVASPASKVDYHEVGEMGGLLRRLRNEADYEDLMPRLDQRAAEAVAIAERIVGMLDELEFSRSRR
jgi:uncharacterized protein (UPF0332 family)